MYQKEMKEKIKIVKKTQEMGMITRQQARSIRGQILAGQYESSKEFDAAIMSAAAKTIRRQRSKNPLS